MANWKIRFLTLAGHIAKWSKDKSTQVGCVITTSDRRIISTGYNGIPRYLSDSVELYPERHDREKDKYSFYEHAERNAIYNAAFLGVSLNGCVLYVTLAPCLDCARAIIQSGIKKVVWDHKKTSKYVSTRRLDLSKTKDILKEAEIDVVDY